MKISYKIAAFFLISLCSFVAKANIANPDPIPITQPDGTTLTVRLHGDEFLHWMTYNNQLIVRKGDGFLYYGTFNPDGTITASSERVVPEAVVNSIREPVVPPAAAVNLAKQKRYVAANSSRPAKSAMGASKSHLVLLVEYSDRAFITDRSYYECMVNQNGFSQNGATGSVRDYFFDNSCGQYDPNFTVVGPLTLPNTMKYYGENDSDGNDIHNQELIRDAVMAAYNAGVDFSQFDQDQNGFVDNIYVFYQGYAESSGAEDDAIWPHSWAVPIQMQDEFHNATGLYIWSYACGSERDGSGTEQDRGPAGIGTFCHEFGHVLGLHDLYDTDYEGSGGKAFNPGHYSLMGAGNYNNNSKTPPYLNSIEREMLGWGSPTEIFYSGNYSLAPISDNASFRTPTANLNEYYIYEYRSKTGWDKHIPAGGMLIYHVDRSENNVHGDTAASLWNNNRINCYPDHPCINIIQSVDPPSDNEANYPFPGPNNNRSFTGSTQPASIDWNMHPTGYDLTNITDNGNSISFRLDINNSYEEAQITGVVTDKSGNPISGITLSFDVTATYSAASADPSVREVTISRQPLKAAKKAGEDTIYSTTDSDGRYSVSVNFGRKYIISINHSLYEPYSATVIINSSTIEHNIKLYRKDEESELILYKFTDSESIMCLGFGERIPNFVAGSLFDKYELADYVGFMVESIHYSIVSENDEPTAETGAALYLKNGGAYSQICRRQLKNTDFSGSINTVGLSDLNIAIGRDQDLFFGYYAKNMEYIYPIAMDNNPDGYIPGGCHISTDGGNTFYEYITGCGNILVSATLKKRASEQPASPYDGLDHYVIILPKLQYSNNDTLTLKLNEVETEVPSSLVWTVNDISCNDGDEITLHTGRYTIKAVLTFPDRTETLCQKLIVD